MRQIEAEIEGKSLDNEPIKQSYDRFRADLEKSGISPQQSHSFLSFVENTIYNPKGVTFSQLLNAQKVLNSYFKETTDPNFKSHIKNAIEGFLRDDIKEGIEAIFKQNQSAYKDVKTLYETALSDYANMKETLKLVDKIKLKNERTTQNQAIESLVNLAKGQGDKTDNLTKITRALSPENRKVVELNMLDSMFKKALYDEKAYKCLIAGCFLRI